MSGVYLTDEELDVLGDADLALPHTAQLLYIRVLRRWMNYADGVVGRKRRISYQQIKEVLECIPSRGRMDNRVTLSKDQIKRLLSRLEDAGLIVSLHDKTARAAMVFRLPLAVCDLVRPNEYRHVCATIKTPHANADMAGAEAGNTATNNTHQFRHTSEYPSNNSLSKTTTTARKEFRMCEGWDVSEGFGNRLISWGVNPQQLSEVQRHAVLEEFVGYWSGQDRCGTQEFWENKLAQSVIWQLGNGLPV